MRILIRGPLDPWTGYGRDVIGLTEALLDLQVDVSVWPLSIAPGLPPRVAGLLSRPAAPGYDVVLWYCPPEQIQPWHMCGWARTQLGWTMWERSPFTSAQLPWWDDDDPDLARGQVWSQRRRNRHAPAKAHLDALIVTCAMNAEAFRSIERHAPIVVIPPGVDVEHYPLADREHTRGPVRFGWVGVPSVRKNLPALLTAWSRWRALRPDADAELHIKSSGLGAGVVEAARLDGVTVHRTTWSTRQLADWYGQLDCLVSVSRGEGMNKPAVEAMATGCPVIAPDWGGHQNWLHPGVTGWAVRHELVDSPIEPGTVDGEVDPAHLVDVLDEVYDDPQERARRGLAGERLVRSSMTWTHAAEQLCKLAARYI